MSLIYPPQVIKEDYHGTLGDEKKVHMPYGNTLRRDHSISGGYQGLRDIVTAIHLEEGFWHVQCTQHLQPKNNVGQCCLIMYLLLKAKL